MSSATEPRVSPLWPQWRDGGAASVPGGAHGTPFARALAAELGRSDAGLPGDPAVAAGWGDVAGLLELAGRLGTRPWVLIEQTPRGVAAGPVFGPDGPCPACYLRRLDSNGQAPPVAPREAALVPLATAALRRLALQPAGTQVEAGPDGRFGIHHLLPVPGCPCGRSGTAPAVPASAAVSDRLGIVHGVRTVGTRAGRVLVAADGADPVPLRGGGGRLRGFGCSADPAAAEAAAVGEVLERYCAGFLPGELRSATRDDLGGESIPPDPYRFAGAALDGTTPLRWVRGRRLTTAAPVWVPAASVFLPYECGPLEPPASRTSSEGLACAGDRAGAVVRATLEAVERDVVMRAWRHGGPVARVPAQLVDDGVAGLHVAVVEAANRPPVAVAFLEDDEPPYCCAGVAGRLDLRSAVDAAVDEAIAVRLVLEHELAAARAGAAQGAPLARAPHARLAALRSSRQRWLCPDRPARARPMSWATLRAALPPAAVVPVTTPDVAVLGRDVVRVVVDGFVGLDPHGSLPRLGGDPTPHPLV